MITDFMFLNVRTPPFNDVRVRQAVNLALDRGLVVNHYGGPVAARPTCQIMPPALAGYRRYCPYTRDPAAGGAWHGPDLARARKLVAASGTAGMRVTVWDTVTPPGTVNETRDAVAMLRQLGYRASLRRLPESTYFAYTLDSRNHAQVIDGGWSADYPSADTFIGKLACSYFAPGNGPATSDGSEFCDPAVDRQITRAAALQATDPQAARPGGRSSTASSPTGRSSCPPSPRTRSTSCPAARATSSTTRSGERSSTSSGSAESSGGDVGVGHGDVPWPR